MSAARHRAPLSEAAARALARMSTSAGGTAREERRRRRRTLDDVAERAGVSLSMVQRMEAGGAASLETYARVFTALDLRPELIAADPRRRVVTAARDEDPVHAAMGELEAARLRAHGFAIALDEPYQHFQFAGRADVVAWDLVARALIHIENRTRVPNVQGALGSYSTKRAYLPAVLAERLGLGRGGWHVVTHAIVAAWTAEALHAIRLHVESFRAACPDSPADFEAWWSGRVPPVGRPTSTLVVLDPLVHGRARGVVGIEAAMQARPRYRGYAELATALREAGAA
jgi:transcriptional regulator with XRE-family HTH domain